MEAEKHISALKQGWESTVCLHQPSETDMHQDNAMFRQQLTDFLQVQAVEAQILAATTWGSKQIS